MKGRCKFVSSFWTIDAVVLVMIKHQTLSILFSCHPALMKKPKRWTRSALSHFSQSLWLGKAGKIWSLWELGFEADPGQWVVASGRAHEPGSTWQVRVTSCSGFFSGSCGHIQPLFSTHHQTQGISMRNITMFYIAWVWRCFFAFFSSFHTQ